MPNPTKRCSKCGETKARSEFSPDRTRKSGLASRCKLCKSTDARERSRHLDYPVSVQEKQCTRCHEVKPAGEFYRKKHNKDGLTYRCRQCIKAAQARWKSRNPEQRRATDAAYREANSERIKARDAAYRAAHREQTRRTNAAYYLENRETIKARSAQWAADNPDKKRANSAGWRANNRERIRATTATWRANNMERVRANRRAWETNNPEKARAMKRAWDTRNPEKRRASDARRRARKNGLLSDFTVAQWQMLVELYDGQCAYCGKPSNKLQQEHVIPIDQDGPYTLSNIVPSCPACNYSKGARTPEQAGMILKPHQWLEVRANA